MLKNVAIVAHFDSNNALDVNTETLLACLARVSDLVILVTTNDISEAQISQLSDVVTIRRPNFGYDFYSYRVGLNYVYEHVGCCNVLLVNSSFIVVDDGLFTRTLERLLEVGVTHDAVGITDSCQMAWHIQSYLVFLNERVVRSQWVKKFFDSVQPRNTKLEVIISYEIGLSRALLANGVKVVTLFKPDNWTRILAEARWMLASARKVGCWGVLRGIPFRHWREVNWVHFGAEQLCRNFGFIKTEVLTTNPHGISTKFILKLAAPAVLSDIREKIANSSSQYEVGPDGLTTHRQRGSRVNSLADRMVSYGRPRAKGIRIAVVVHLFYKDLLDEICDYLTGIIEPFDLYVTTPFEGDIEETINKAAKLAHSVTILVLENQGRDIAPFLALYRHGYLDNYFVILKLHSKKSKYSSRGEEWRRQIFDSLLGDASIIRKILRLFDDSSVGLVGPHEFYLSNSEFWGANYNNVRQLLMLAGHRGPCSDSELGFFAGSMFWFVPDAFSALKDMPEISLNFEQEQGQQDGTLAHAIERIFCTIVRRAGYRVTSLPLAGVDISHADTWANRIPVLG